MTRAGAASTPAVLLVVTGLACQEIGASLAVMLFPTVGPLGMVMLRLVFSALILLVIARPALRGHARHAWAGWVPAQPSPCAPTRYVIQYHAAYAHTIEYTF